MRLTILILLGLAYTLNSIVLGWVYPNVSTDFVLTFGSIIDKSLGITWYLKSDVLLIIISFILSGIVYVRERK